MDKLNKGAKIYLEKALKVSLHPVRRDIIKLLKKNDSLSTLDLQEKLNEDRYNLYHHLNILEESLLIKKDFNKSSGKVKYYQINNVTKPIMAAFSFEKNEINEHKKSLYKALEILENIENSSLPNKNNIEQIEINITYNWDK